MLTSLDEQGGLILETSSQMEELERKVNVLEAYWNSHLDELHVDPSSGLYGHVPEHLGESMQHLRQAIGVAKANGATLGIS